MATFLFWNICRRPILELIVRLAHSHDVDVLMLAECDIEQHTLQMALSRDQQAAYLPAPGISEPRLHIYSRYIPRFIQPVRDSGGIAIRRIQPPLGRDILLVAVHLASKLYQTEDDQALACTRLARIINEEEHRIGHSRTVVVGDLNMNPFEYGVVGADGLHSVMDRRIAKRVFRRVQGENRAFFYNPMWNYFGDMPPGPPGTCFFDTGKQINFFWHMFDQVLIRSELLDAFRNEDLMIITEVDGTSLLTGSGRPNAKVGSDHLPIVFRLHL